ncbi:MAG: acetoacetate--CoA ligase [Gammaproteobacteria bacterium]
MNETIWQPSPEVLENAQLTRFCHWLEKKRGLVFANYDALWRWSTDDVEAFWGAIWDYFDIQSPKAIDEVLADASMPGAKWFTGTSLNYAAQVFRHRTDARPAIIFQSETTELIEVSWAELEQKVATFASYLKDVGVQSGDRVVGYMPNQPEAVIAFLASASIGAVWSLCAPDLGSQAVLDRFRQIEPMVLVAADGYTYNGKYYDRTRITSELVADLPSLANVVLVPQRQDDVVTINVNASTVQWGEATTGDHKLQPTAVPFDHPLWVLYSSGTTGKPKAIVHSQGGIVIEHLKTLHFHIDLGDGDRFFWYSSTAWMMWNFQVGGLLLGATICLYDGNPAWPDMNRLWQFIDDCNATFFGAGAAFFDGCRNASLTPKKDFSLAALRAIGSTGSPLLPESYRWIYGEVDSDLYLVPISGGTDFASGFVGGVPTLPVKVGAMSCRCLGAAVAARNENGEDVIDEVGELVCTKPMPSMPLYFWDDEDDGRYRDSYFDVWPGVWRHGDWIEITSDGGAIIYGRSDATINRHGVRMGTSELYAAVEALPEVVDSLVVDLEYLGRDSYMPLFVVLRSGTALSEELTSRIRATIKSSLSPRHVPNDVFEIDDVPRTFSGKKLEIPIRKLLLGGSQSSVINRATMSNPQSVDYFIEFAQRLN